MAKDRLSGKLAVILHADVAGSTALVQQDKELAHERIQDTFQRFSDTIEKYQGHVVELRGDALLAEFERASDAVSAALSFQSDHAYHNSRLKDDLRPTVRVGIAMGEVIVADSTVTGAGVVQAQRIEQLAEPGGVCITAAIHEALSKRLPFDFGNLGEQVLKGFDHLVHVYQVELRPGESMPPPQQKSKNETSLKHWNPMVAAALFVLVIIGGFTYWSINSVPREEPASVDNMAFPLPEVPSIAILPFSNLSGDPEQEYFSDGLTANVITTLSQLPDVVVIARDSMLNYRDRPAKIRYVAEELGIRYVLDGSFQRTNERVRVHVQLIDALTGKHLWADRFDKPWTDIFVLQDTITENIVSALEIKLTEEQKARLAAQYTNSIQAYEYFLRGQLLFFRYTREDNLEARQLYLQAIELDPDFARAYGAVSLTYDQDYHRDPNDQSMALGLRYARKGIALDGDLPHSHVALGRIGLHSKNPDQAVEALHRAIELDSNFADAYAQLAVVYTIQGQAEKAFPLLRKAVRLNPNHGAGYDFTLGRVHYHMRRYEEAVIALERAVESNPARIRSRLLLAASFAQLGRDEDAEWQIAEVTANHESDAIQAFLTGWLVIDQTYREHLEDGFRKAGLAELAE
jgi:TolB-like protein/class 3 adenylate cyclase